MSLEALLSSTSTPPSSDGEEGTSALPSDELGQDIVWTAASEAMQALSGHLVLIIRCDHALPNTGINLLGRLVGCVANAHIAAQVCGRSQALVVGARRDRRDRRGSLPPPCSPHVPTPPPVR